MGLSSILLDQNKFFHCTMCIGFWVGMFVHVFMQGMFDEFFAFHIRDWEFYGVMFLMGCISSGTSYALSSIIGDNGIKINME